jgi:EAL domain-containing protein (putative c-di-GMP-specific phosphodiesterase class I)
VAELPHKLKQVVEGSPSAAPGDPALVQAVNQAPDPKLILERIVAQSLALVPAADGAAVELLLGGDLVYVCGGGSMAAHVGFSFPMERSLSGLSMATGQVLRSDDTESDLRVNIDACRHVGAASMICIPLKGRGGPIGSFKVASGHQGAFQDGDVTVLEGLAPFITALVTVAADLASIVPALLRAFDLASLNTPQPDSVAMADSGTLMQFVANVMRPGMADQVAARRRIQMALEPESMTMLAQPIYRLGTGELHEVEALARFHLNPARSPDKWFAEGYSVGLGVDLELSAVRQALALVPQVPVGVRLAINVGPATAADSRLEEILGQVEGRRIVLELTEHVEIDDYPTLRQALNRYRSRGVKLSADDTGAGVSGLTHILQIAPDYIKLDRELTKGIELDPVRRSLATALVTFAADSGAEVVAEGIESAEALEVLTELGVTYGQGYHLGRPAPIEQLRHRSQHRTARHR